MFIGPAMAFFAFFTVYPLLSSFYYAFNRIGITGGKLAATYVGLANFRPCSRTPYSLWPSATA